MLNDLAFSIPEYRGRVGRLQEEMRKRGIDVFLVNNRADVCYLTGIETCYMVAYHACIVPGDGNPILVASDFEMLNALAGAWPQERVTFSVKSGDPIETTCAALKERGYASKDIGIQPPNITAQQYKKICDLLPRAKFVDAGDILFMLKVVKSPAEIEYLRRAGKLTSMAMDAALKVAGPGKTDNDIAACAYYVMANGGSEYMCIDPIVTAGSRSGIPHTSFRRTVLQPGDPVLVEIGACIRRYSTPMMRSIILAPESKVIRDALDACRNCLGVLIREMKPGAIGCEIAAKAKEAWYPLCEQLIWHGCYAYSVGIGFPPDWNDAPVFVSENSDVILKPGMCFHATTSLRCPGKYGVAMSETVLITESGPEILTRHD